MYALCSAAGEITFAPRIPRDLSLLPVAHGPAKKLRDMISGVARHAYDGETLLVPGIPETQGDQVAGVDALRRFQKWIKPHFEKHGLSVP